jgi:hypothetical protein
VVVVVVETLEADQMVVQDQEEQVREDWLLLLVQLVP